jgi:hypothetical protein
VSERSADDEALAAYVRQVVEQAGELTPEHLERIRALLPPVEAEHEHDRDSASPQ